MIIDTFESVHKVMSVIDKFVELHRLIKSLSDYEFSLLEKSLEQTKKEMEQ